MTVRPGDSWGKVVARPADLRTVSDDHELAVALSDGSGVSTAVLAGDLARTLGTSTSVEGSEIGEFAVDLIEVTLDDGLVRNACAHVIARSPWWRGSWWTGPVLAVMNAQFRGVWDVAPRGHPNDGRVETFMCEANFPLRQRFAVSRRLPSGTHLPHPEISTRAVRKANWNFKRPASVFIDGLMVARSRSVEVSVLPDRATVYR